jgi:hypothetical protein
MRNNVIATYTHDDQEVRFLMRWTFATAFFAGITVGIILMKW